MNPPTLFKPDDLVVLPSGRRALVLKVDGDRVDCEIISEKGRLQDRTVCLKASLLRKVVRGAAMPQPARVT